MTSTVARIGLAGLVLGATLTGAASPAQAAVRDGRCDPGEFCLYFDSGRQGSVSDFRESVSNYGTAQPSCYDFRGVGRGKGTCIKNAAASVWNRSAVSVRVHYNSGYGGASQTIAAGAQVDLDATLKNQNASHRFLTTVGDPRSPRSGDDYPYRGQTKGTDKWDFYIGQCTSFAAHALNTRVGVRFTNYYKGPRWSHAMHWDDVARRVGIPVSRTPRAGSIAVRNSGRYGHVAFVTKVHSNGSFEVDEYNFRGTSRYSHRTTRVGTGSAYFDAFIHFT